MSFFKMKIEMKKKNAISIFHFLRGAAKT